MSVDPTESGRETLDAPEARAFARDSGPRGVYLNPTLQQRLDLIEHLIEFGRQIIVLSGRIDSGKSTLLNYFTAAQRASWFPIRIHAGSGLTGDGLLALLAQELDVAPEAPEESVSSDQVRQRIAVLERAGKVVVLLVDDAEQLSPETATLVVKLAHAEDQYAELRVLLAADLDQSALLETLQRAHPQHGLVHVVEIPRLVDSQVQALIEQRMQSAELNAADYFSVSDYARIAAAAGGLVGKVVTLARQHVAGIAAPAARKVTRRSTNGLSRAHVNLIFGILAATAIGVGAWFATRNPLVPSSTQTETVALEPSPALEPPEPALESLPPTEPLPLESELDVPPPVNSEGPAEEAVAGELIAAPVPSTPNPPPVPVVPSEIAPSVAVTSPPTLPVQRDSEGPLEIPPTVTSPATREPPAVSQPSRKARTEKVLAPLTQPPVAPKVGASQSPPRVQTPRTASPAGPVVSNFSADWLRKQPANAHTLQLFGVHERSAAERYRNQHGITKQSAILTGSLNGKSWYVVVYGYYPNRAAAITAMSRLPSSLRDTKPWARSIGSLRNAVQ